MEREEKLLEAVRDLVWLGGLIATELIQITENTSKALRGEIPENCKVQHARLREKAIEIVERNCPERAKELKEHVLGHGN